VSFPRYPKYKPSGVEWLGDVPEHWALPKLKSVATFSGGGTPSRENPAYWNGDIPWVSPKDMKAERIEGAEESITLEGLESSASNLLSPGRLLIVVRSGILKHTIPIAINETAVALNQDMKALSFDATKCVGRFFLRWVQGHNDQLLFAWAKQGATVESIEHSYLAQTVVPLPDIPEQTAIAEFLDWETAKIDGLVAEQRRLIELLKEKRQAVISHAVTKGLNPHASMKPSGIEWLGDVPKHWTVTRLGFLCSKIGSGKTPLGGGEAYLTEGILFIRSQNVYDEGLYLTDVVYVSEATDSEQSWSRVLAGDILLNITGASLGRTCLVPDNFEPANVNQHVCILRLASHASRQFVSMVLKSSGMKAQFDAAQNGAAREGLNFAQISKLALAVPPAAEQAEILKFLETEIAKFDTLTAEAQRAIDLLQERRTALISAAVTGQIDVRQQTHN